MLHVDAAHEADHAPPGDPLDRFAELWLCRVLEHHADVAQALLLTHVAHAALDGSEAVAEVSGRRSNERALHRYGFHGLNVSWCHERALQIPQAPLLPRLAGFKPAAADSPIHH